jgi:hypothetical protein
MRQLDLIWDEGPGGNVEHLAWHDVTPDEVADVLHDPASTDISRSSGRPIARGFTRAGRRLVVVYEYVDAMTAYPITAYEPD